MNWAQSRRAFAYTLERTTAIKKLWNASTVKQYKPEKKWTENQEKSGYVPETGQSFISSDWELFSFSENCWAFLFCRKMAAIIWERKICAWIERNGNGNTESENQESSQLSPRTMFIHDGVGIYTDTRIFERSKWRIKEFSICNLEAAVINHG